MSAPASVEIVDVTVYADTCPVCDGPLREEWPACSALGGALASPASSREAWEEWIPEGYGLCRCPCHVAVMRGEQTLGVLQ